MKDLKRNQNYCYEDLHLLSFGQFWLENHMKCLKGVIFDVDTDSIFVSFNNTIPRDNMLASFKLCENIYFYKIKTKVVRRYKDADGLTFVRLELIDLSQKEKELFEECVPKWRIKYFIEDWY